MQLSERLCFFRFPIPAIDVFQDGSKNINYSWFHLDLHLLQLFQLPGKIQTLIYLFTFILYVYDVLKQQNSLDDKFFFLFCKVWLGTGDPLVYQNPRKLGRFQILIFAHNIW